MKKIERLNTMMRYMNNRAHFTITELMDEFHISRSTAIRDVREIESMGMPLVAEVGRDGGYSVMHNQVLPTIRFTDNEIKALFVAFMATRNQQLPYLRSRQSLSEKLLGLISENQQDDLVQLNEILLFQGTNPNNPDLLELTDLPQPIFEELIQQFLRDRNMTFTMKNGEVIYAHSLRLYRDSHKWFVEVYDIECERIQVISVNELNQVSDLVAHKKLTTKQIRNLIRQEEEVNVIIELGQKAIMQYKKYHPLRISLSYIDPYQLTGIIHTYVDTSKIDEVEELMNWIAFLGRNVKIHRVPDQLRNCDR